MQVEIWSDVMCPFCYIGKRKFEAALSQFADSAAIQVIWKPKSDQNVILDAYMTTAPFGSAKKTALSKETTKKHYRGQCRIERC